MAKKLSKKIKDFLEEEGISLDESFQEDEHYAEMHFGSDLGEDFVFTIWSDGSEKDFVEKFGEYATDFDPDEHVEMWIPSRGKNGVPSSIRALLKDADAIKERLEDLAEKLAHLR